MLMPGASLGQDSRSYRITTVTYSGNAIGVTASVAGYRAQYHQRRQAGGAIACTFDSFETAGAAASQDQLAWQALPGFAPFTVTVSGYGDLAAAMDNMTGLPHATLESFDLYVTLMDVIMYEQFRGAALNELIAAGRASWEQEAYDVTLPDWKPIIRRLKITAGPTAFLHVSAAADGNLFYYKTDDTIIRQLIVYGGFIMPSYGTSRYMGFYRLDGGGELTHATLSEYYAGLVIAAYFLPVLSTERREQALELIADGG
jgi:hypothetical protein